jgi:hypothetical protein
MATKKHDVQGPNGIVYGELEMGSHGASITPGRRKRDAGER